MIFLTITHWLRKSLFKVLLSYLCNRWAFTKNMYMSCSFNQLNHMQIHIHKGNTNSRSCATTSVYFSFAWTGLPIQQSEKWHRSRNSDLKRLNALDVPKKLANCGMKLKVLYFLSKIESNFIFQLINCLIPDYLISF